MATVKRADVSYLEAVDCALRALDESRVMWSWANEAILDARLMRRRAHAAIDELAKDQHFRENYRNDMLGLILRAIIAATNACMGNIQTYDPLSGCLVLQAQKGFYAPLLDHFQTVAPEHPARGTASERRQRVIIEDVTNNEVFAADPSLEVFLDAGIRAVQSTPISGSRNQLLGVLSTYYRAPISSTEVNFKIIDHYVKWAADLIEWCGNKRASEEQNRGSGLTIRQPFRPAKRPRVS